MPGVPRPPHSFAARLATSPTLTSNHLRLRARLSSCPVLPPLVGTAVDMETVTQNEVVKFSAGGFRDFTRIAASDPVMWRDVFLSNREATLEVVDRFIEDLSALKRAIRWEDGEALLEHFAKTRDIRRRIVDAGQDSSEANFGRDES